MRTAQRRGALGSFDERAGTVISGFLLGDLDKAGGAPVAGELDTRRPESTSMVEVDVVGVGSTLIAGVVPQRHENRPGLNRYRRGTGSRRPGSTARACSCPALRLRSHRPDARWARRVSTTPSSAPICSDQVGQCPLMSFSLPVPRRSGVCKGVIRADLAGGQPVLFGRIPMGPVGTQPVGDLPRHDRLLDGGREPLKSRNSTPSARYPWRPRSAPDGGRRGNGPRRYGPVPRWRSPCRYADAR